MAQPVHLNDAVKRPMQSWLMNGTDDLTFGLMLVVYGSMDRAGVLLSKDASLAGYLPPLKMALMALFGFALTKGVRGLKEQIIYPRAGYVAFREPPLRDVIYIVIAGVIFLFGCLLTIVFKRTDLAGPAMALFFAVGYLVEGIRQKVPHMVGFAVFAFLLAGWVYLMRAETDERFFWVTIGLGGALMVSGGMRLVKFLRINPIGGDREAME